MDRFKIDSHKLIYHIPRIHQWLQGKNIYPLYIEISLYGGCNHRCIFCAFDFLKYKPVTLNKDCLKKFAYEAATRGIKSILFSGEGEPLLHRDASEIVIFTKKSGMDVALSTNGVMLDKEKAKSLLGCLSWLRVSLNSATKSNYSLIHGTSKEDFNIVINNLERAVKIKDNHKHNCIIGVQFLLIPQNYREIIRLARMLKDIGVDYLAIKPYSHHASSNNRVAECKLKYADLFYLEKKLDKYSKGNFQIIFRRRAMEKIEEKKPYKYCLGLPFASHITAEGDIYPCNFFIGQKKYSFGNIYRQSLQDIWCSDRRKDITDMIYKIVNMAECRRSCRLDEINRYLWELKNPINCVNFI